MSSKAPTILGAFFCLSVACNSDDQQGDASTDATQASDAAVADDFGTSDGSLFTLCDLPGSVRTTANGQVVVAGGKATPDVSFVKVPPGFCVHYFGNVPSARQIRFAPGGDLFVASPSTATAGGSPSGDGAVVILPDDDHDGYADQTIPFVTNVASVQGLLFTSTDFYYQSGTTIQRLPFQAGERVLPNGATSTTFADITYYESQLHWPKTLDMADDGTIYVGNGGDQPDNCVTPHPAHGGILQIDGQNLGGTLVAQGTRNAIAVRCAHGHNRCFALELALDGSATTGGREKLIPIHAGDDWGYPCCATTNTPYGTQPTDCSTTATEIVSFEIGETPFGFDFEPGAWPGTWAGRVFIALHGTAGFWTGARVVSVPMDPTTGAPVVASDLSGTETNGMSDFATGWGDGARAHGRPAALTFAPDGRLFLANDNNGDIFWIAPFE